MSELPHLVDVQREFEAQGGRLLGVSYDLMETRDATRAEARIRGVFGRPGIGEFTTVVFESLTTHQLEELLELSPDGVPQTVAIDRRGEIVDHQLGAAGRGRLAEMMRKALR